MLATPATRAGAAHIRTVDGYRRPAARSVDPGPPDRPRQVADGDPAVDHVRRWFALVLVVGEYAAEGHFQRLEQVGLDARPGVVHLAVGDAQAAGHVHPVELGRVAHERLVPLVPDPGEDAGHGVVDVGTRCGRARQDRVERRPNAA